MAAVTFGDIEDLKRQPTQGFPQPINAELRQTMPATSKKQFRFMQAVAHGNIKKPGLSKAEAAEYVGGQSPKNLPTKAPRRHKVSFPKPTRPK